MIKLDDLRHLHSWKKLQIHSGFKKEDPEVPSKIEWDLTNGPQNKLLELLDAQV